MKWGLTCSVMWMQLAGQLASFSRLPLTQVKERCPVEYQKVICISKTVWRVKNTDVSDNKHVSNMLQWNSLKKMCLLHRKWKCNIYFHFHIPYFSLISSMIQNPQITFNPNCSKLCSFFCHGDSEKRPQYKKNNVRSLRNWNCRTLHYAKLAINKSYGICVLWIFPPRISHMFHTCFCGCLVMISNVHM